MKIIVIFLAILSFSASAGNGVERGSVMIRGNSELSPEIKSYVAKVLSRCSSNLEEEHFQIADVSTLYQKIDQGITDVFYRIKLNHHSEKKELLNTVTLEILDSDFDNWRDYEEKLSFEIIKDQNKRCY